MKCCTETQAFLSGEGPYRRLCGRILVSCQGRGSVVQTHIRNLPCQCAFLGLCLELCGRRYPLPELLVYRGEALMSVYTGAFTPKDTVGGLAVLIGDPCLGARGTPIACGRLSACFSPDCCSFDPRPLFAAPIRWSPDESTFY